MQLFLAYPARPQTMHMINMPPPMEAVFTLYKSFANEKMQKRMRAHLKGEGYSALIESLGKEVLPVEYGGTNGTLQEHIGNSNHFNFCVKHIFEQQSLLGLFLSLLRLHLKDIRG